MNAAKTQEFTRRVIRMLPDDSQKAIATIALCHANIVVASGCDDESAIGAFKIALAQMRQGDWWKG